MNTKSCGSPLLGELYPEGPLAELPACFHYKMETLIPEFIVDEKLRYFVNYF